jgi:hypothetical protein
VCICACLQIINVAANPRTPTLTIYLNSDMQDQEGAKKVVDLLEYITLSDVTVSTQVSVTPRVAVRVQR